MRTITQFNASKLKIVWVLLAVKEGCLLFTGIAQGCRICSKDFDDIVRQVHSDLKSGRLLMIDILRKSVINNAETLSKNMQTSDCMAHCDGCQCHLPMDQRTPFQRDFTGNTSLKKCICNDCTSTGQVMWGKKPDPPGKPEAFANAASYRSRMTHMQCDDGDLKDLHNHVLAGDKNVSGEEFIKMLDNLHEEGPCEKDCKLKADLVWMEKGAPKQAETQTENVVNHQLVQTDVPCTHDIESQTELERSIGIQKGNALAQLTKVKPPWQQRSIVCESTIPYVPPDYRPVCRVVSVQSLL